MEDKSTTTGLAAGLLSCGRWWSQATSLYGAEFAGVVLGRRPEVRPVEARWDRSCDPSLPQDLSLSASAVSASLRLYGNVALSLTSEVEAASTPLVYACRKILYDI